MGNAEAFDAWQQSDQEAWFFLDSVDEARLNHPTAFEKAIGCFATKVARQMHRIHVCISSRPYAWRAISDRMVDEHLPLAASDPKDRSASPLKVYWLCPLQPRPDIELYAAHRKVSDIDRMLEAIDRADLLAIAERPFDLDNLIVSWKKHANFSSRLAMLREGIRQRLKEIDPDRAEQQDLPTEHALEGLRQLAAGVVLSGEQNIRVPDGQLNTIDLDAEDLLTDWSEDKKAIKELLLTGVFNDAIYGAVRIRHREMCDLLAAEWFHALLKAGAPRHNIEALIFTKQYGESVIRPRMRPLLPWLMLWDESIRQQTLALSPEIAVEGGDVSQLPLAERRCILHKMVAHIAAQQDDRNGRYNQAIERLAKADLEQDAHQLIDTYKENDDAIFFLSRFVCLGQLKACAPPLERIACTPSRAEAARRVSIRAVATVGTSAQRYAMWETLLAQGTPFPRVSLAELIDEATPDEVTVDLLIRTLTVLELCL